MYIVILERSDGALATAALDLKKEIVTEAVNHLFNIMPDLTIAHITELVETIQRTPPE